jgi:acyl-CoA synthetase (AMP-forming)/AMP-acid ligase II
VTILDPAPTRSTSLGASMQISLGESIALTARNVPDRAAFLFPDGSEHSFAQTNARVNRLVSALRAEGVGKGDRLAILALDSHRFVEVVLAACKLGAVYVPLNYRLRRNEVDVLTERARPTAFFYDVRYADLLEGVGEQHGIRLVLALDERPGETESEYERFIATGAEVEPPVVATDGDVVGLAFTSGTTGLPKGVLQSQRMMKAIVTEQIIEFRMLPEEVRYTAAPAFHITGICQLLAGVSYGFTSLVVPQFDPRVTLDFLASDTLTGVFMVPTMISTLLQLPDVHDHEYERLQLMYYGAAAMSPALLKRAMDTFHCDFLNAFGAGTEAGLQALLGPEDHRRALAGRPELLGSIGKPAFGVALRIVDDEMNDVAPGEVGEIATRSDMQFDGYLEMPEETERATRDGWFRAGDMGYVDPNGYLYLHGRKKDMIVRGGENIYPIEIESVLSEHPDVVQSAAVGVADEHWSEIVRVWVQLREGSTVTAEELAAHCATRLAKYKVPSEFRFATALPINASGKILKRELREWE